MRLPTQPWSVEQCGVAFAIHDDLLEAAPVIAVVFAEEHARAVSLAGVLLGLWREFREHPDHAIEKARVLLDPWGKGRHRPPAGPWIWSPDTGHVEGQGKLVVLMGGLQVLGDDRDTYGRIVAATPSLFEAWLNLLEQGPRALGLARSILGDL
jgi:hypothetical protein